MFSSPTTPDNSLAKQSNSSTGSARTHQSSSMVKIIDIQKHPKSKSAEKEKIVDNNDDDDYKDDDEAFERQQRRNSAGRSSVPSYLGQQQQQHNLPSSRQTPSVSQARGQQHKQQSGETLSSFESDYDLLVYLGETETEDIVDTERSLDYQDQTWRQSICGGASLAPTIDESLSELLGSYNLQGNELRHKRNSSACDSDVLNTPVQLSTPNSPFGSTSRTPPATPANNRSLQPPAGSSRGVRRALKENENETLGLNNSIANQRYPSTEFWQQVSSSNETKRDDQQQQQQKFGTFGNKLVSLFNRRPAQEERQIDSNRLSSLGEYSDTRSRTLDERSMRDYAGQTNYNNNNMSSGLASDILSANEAAELDRLLAEMSQSLDLNSLARFDPHQSSLSRDARQSLVGQTSRTLSKFHHQVDQQIPPPTTKAFQHKAPDARQERKSFSVQKLGSEIGASSKPMQAEEIRARKQTASNESILDEYDGASKMLEQMISDQLSDGRTRKRTIEIRQDSMVRNLSRSDSPRSIGSSSIVAGKKSANEAEHEMLRKQSTCSSSVATESSVIPAAGRLKRTTEGSFENRSVWEHPRRSLRSNRSSLERSQAVDNSAPETGQQTFREVWRNSTAVATATATEARDADSDSVAPPPPEVDYNEEDVIRVEAAEMSSLSGDDSAPPTRGPMDRMKRRTMSSMRSMRNKLSDLMNTSESKTSRKNSQIDRSQIAPEAPTRAAPFEGAKELPERAARERRRENSLGQQIRERLSRSKSRLVDRFLGRPKRAQSQPNTRPIEAPEPINRDEELFQPSDIARNSEPVELEQVARDSSARKVSSSSSSSLSGLEEASLRTRSSRQSKRRGKSKERRSSSLQSIKRALKAREKEANEDLDSMKVRCTPDGIAGANRKKKSGRRSQNGELVSANLISAEDYLSRAKSAEQKEPSLSKRPNRSQSMKNVEGRVSPSASMTREARTVSFTNLNNRRVPASTNTFRPASVCVQLATEPAPPADEWHASTLPVTPVAPSLSVPIQEPAERPARSPIRARGAAVLGELKSKCNELFASPSAGRKAAPKAESELSSLEAPQRPPRRRSKSVCAKSDQAAEVIEVEASSPPLSLTLERGANGTATGGASPSSGLNLGSLAQQLKNSAADFFHQAERKDKRRRPPTGRSQTQSPAGDLCDWRPVIGGSSMAGKRSKDEQQKQPPHIVSSATLPNRTQSDTFRQGSLDTDSSWESSGDEDDEGREKPIVQADESERKERVGLQASEGKLLSSLNLQTQKACEPDKLAKQAAETPLMGNKSKRREQQAFTKPERRNNNNNNDDDDDQIAPPNEKQHERQQQQQLQQVVDVIPLKFQASMIDARQEVDVEKSANEAFNSTAERNNIEERICKTPFKFNANLPTPSQLIEQEKLASSCGIIEREQEGAAMTAIAARRQQDQNEAQRAAGKESESEQTNRLSVYENVSQTSSHQSPRMWRKQPPAPPTKPANLLARTTKSPPSSRTSWSAEAQDQQVSSVPDPGALATRLRLQQSSLVSQQEADDLNKEPAAAPEAPKWKLVTMTSIIQDPNDELMVGASSSSANHQLNEALRRRDSTFTTNGDNSEDSDSSFAAAAVNRSRLLSKFESAKLEEPKGRVKFPAFTEGKSAPSRGPSLVKRLAKTFDQNAQEQQQPGRAPPRLKSAPSVENDESTRSESTWYDANCPETLDEAEVAEFLRDFDGQRPRLTELSAASGSASVSTGADPFVTVADSTIEDDLGLRRSVDDREEEEENTLNEDDTLNDEDDEMNSMMMSAPEDNNDLTPLEPRSYRSLESQLEQQGKDNKQAAHVSFVAKTAAVSSLHAANDNTNNNNDHPAAQVNVGDEFKIERSVSRAVAALNEDKRDNYESNTVHAAAKLPPLPPLPPPPPRETLTLAGESGAHIIDNKFKNSLNHIIARRSLQPSGSESTQSMLKRKDDQVVVDKSKLTKSKKEKKAPKATSSDTGKEYKGFSRYCRALLQHSRGKKKKRKKKKEKEKEVDEHYASSSSSSSSSSSTCSTASSSICNSAASSEDENEDSHSMLDNKKLAKAVKKYSRIYEELERILAHRTAKKQLKKEAASAANSNQSKQDSQKNNSIEEEEELEEGEEEEEFNDYYDLDRFKDDQISLSSSSVSSGSIPEIRQRQNLQKLYHVVNEIYSSEAKFVDTLRLLNEDFRMHISKHQHQQQHNQIPIECSNSMLKHLPQLQALNENLMEELKIARDEWPRTQKIAHVLVKIGPFLKHYSTYIREFETMQQQLNENIKRYPGFGEKIKEFEASERSQKLTIQHHLLKPIQRIPQYRLLLQQYLHHLKPDDADYEDTVNALEVVSRVAEHANQSMNEGANFAKLLALQAKIVGKQKNIVQPGRLFVKEGELMKICRKQVQPRWFVLLNDALLYLTQFQSSDILYLNNELPLDDCLVSTPNEQQSNLVGQHEENEFSICTRARSFALIAKTRAERDHWVQILRQTIDEHMARRRSFAIRQAAAKSNELGSQQDQAAPSPPISLLGQKAPIWTPDFRVTMCQLCTSSFSALFRRHHCRACGRVVCSACSSNKAPLIYLKCRAARVCDECFELLKANIHLYYLPASRAGSVAPPAGAKADVVSEQELRRLDEHFRTLLRSQFKRQKPYIHFL